MDTDRPRSTRRCAVWVAPQHHELQSISLVAAPECPGTGTAATADLCGHAETQTIVVSLVWLR